MERRDSTATVADPGSTHVLLDYDTIVRAVRRALQRAMPHESPHLYGSAVYTCCDTCAQVDWYRIPNCADCVLRDCVEPELQKTMRALRAL
jgi:hypothetical protein